MGNNYYDIYPSISMMNQNTHKKRIILYLWIAVVHVVLSTLINLSIYPNELGNILINNLWRAPFVIAINWTYLERMVPYIRKKRKYLAVNILLFLFISWILLMLSSFGLYAWRLI